MEAKIKIYPERYTYVDLGLTSGTQWATENVFGLFRHDEAVEAAGDSLPTMDQVIELLEECKWKFDADREGYNIKGPNGNVLFLELGGMSYDGKSTSGAGEYGNYWAVEAASDGQCGKLGVSAKGFRDYVYESKYYRCSIRLVRNNPAMPKERNPHGDTFDKKGKTEKELRSRRNKLGWVLRNILLSRGQSIAYMCTQCGCSEHMYRKWLKTGEITLELAAAFARFAGLHKEFFTELRTTVSPVVKNKEKKTTESGAERNTGKEKEEPAATDVAENIRASEDDVFLMTQEEKIDLLFDGKTRITREELYKNNEKIGLFKNMNSVRSWLYQRKLRNEIMEDNEGLYLPDDVKNDNLIDSAMNETTHSEMQPETAPAPPEQQSPSAPQPKTPKDGEPLPKAQLTQAYTPAQIAAFSRELVSEVLDSMKKIMEEELKGFQEALRETYKKEIEFEQLNTQAALETCEKKFEALRKRLLKLSDNLDMMDAGVQVLTERTAADDQQPAPAPEAPAGPPEEEDRRETAPEQPREPLPAKGYAVPMHEELLSRGEVIARIGEESLPTAEEMEDLLRRSRLQWKRNGTLRIHSRRFGTLPVGAGGWQVRDGDGSTTPAEGRGKTVCLFCRDADTLAVISRDGWKITKTSVPEGSEFLAGYLTKIF